MIDRTVHFGIGRENFPEVDGGYKGYCMTKHGVYKSNVNKVLCGFTSEDKHQILITGNGEFVTCETCKNLLKEERQFFTSRYISSEEVINVKNKSEYFKLMLILAKEGFRYSSAYFNEGLDLWESFRWNEFKSSTCVHCTYAGIYLHSKQHSKDIGFKIISLSEFMSKHGLSVHFDIVKDGE